MTDSRNDYDSLSQDESVRSSEMPAAMLVVNAAKRVIRMHDEGRLQNSPPGNSRSIKLLLQEIEAYEDQQARG